MIRLANLAPIKNTHSAETIRHSWLAAQLNQTRRQVVGPETSPASQSEAVKRPGALPDIPVFEPASERQSLSKQHMDSWPS